MDKKIIELAIDNITKYGDTDIFPFPLDNYILFDKKDEIIELLQEIDYNFDTFINKEPPVNISTLSPVGYTGFRWATMIDPIWNAYFLSLVLSISEKIEESRIKYSENFNNVYSYRYAPDFDNGSLFSKDINWKKFYQDSYDFIKESDCNYLVICDIADFYTRIYHHRLERAISRLNIVSDIPKKIMKILQVFSGTNSYGLPIGGPAARILAELALNGTDKIIKGKRIRFNRFVDDYHLFCKTREEAHFNLNFIAMKLMKNEGLSLQKHKTQVISKNEFLRIVESKIKSENDDEQERERSRFMNLPINYDPYSDNADEEYKELKKELSQFDIVGLLNEELRKVRIHQQFSRQILKSFTVLDSKIVSNAFVSICKKIDSLYPIFPTLMITSFKVFDNLTTEAKEVLFNKLRELVDNDSYIVQLELNTAYLIRVLGKEFNEENEEIIIKLYDKFNESMLVRNTIYQVMTKWKLDHWISDKKTSFPTMNKWEIRLFIISSYILGDEGKHWRTHHKKEFTKYEIIARDWASEKFQNDSWTLPL